jgi:hypothetical protein
MGASAPAAVLLFYCLVCLTTNTAAHSERKLLIVQDVSLDATGTNSEHPYELEQQIQSGHHALQLLVWHITTTAAQFASSTSFPATAARPAHPQHLEWVKT